MPGQTDMFLQVGKIKGESDDDKHAGKIDIRSWSWGLSNSADAHTGGGSGKGKVKVNQLHLTKYTDKSTPSLVKSCCTGEHHPTASLICRKAGGTALEYFTITLEEVFITEVSLGHLAGDDKLMETITLSFDQFKVEYKTQSKTGGVGSQTPDVTWNIKLNKKM